MNVVVVTAGYKSVIKGEKRFYFRSETDADRFIQTMLSKRYDLPFVKESVDIKPTREILMATDKNAIDYAVENFLWAQRVKADYDKTHLTEEEYRYIRQVAYSM